MKRQRNLRRALVAAWRVFKYEMRSVSAEERELQLHRKRLFETWKTIDLRTL